MLPRGAITGLLVQGKQEGQSQRRKWDERSRGSERKEDATLLALSVKEEATSQGVWVGARSWKRQGNLLPENLWREHSPADTLISAQRNPFHTSDFQNCKTIHLCCFKPSGLW